MSAFAPRQWLHSRWQQLAFRFDAQSLRERAVIIIGLAGLLLYAWDSLGMRSLYSRARNTAALLAAAAPADTASELERLVDMESQLQAQQAQKQLHLEQRAASLVDPEKMTTLLTDIIKSSRGVRLVKLSNLPVEELHAPETGVHGGIADTANTAATPADGAPAMAYVHGIDITVAGDYAAVTAYIRALEAQPWHFLWRKLELDATNYPEVNAHINLATLGLDKQWLTI